MLFLGVGDGIAWQGTFRGPRQTGDGYNAGGKRKAPTNGCSFFLGVGDGIALDFLVGLLKDVLSARIKLAFDSLDDVIAVVGFHVAF